MPACRWQARSGRPRLFALPSVVSRKASAEAEPDAMMLPEGLETGDPVLVPPSGDQTAYLVLKRTLDLTVAWGVAIVLGWLLLVVWLLVRVDSPGPGLLKQTRLGKNEKPFRCYKFRTMVTSTPERGTHEVDASSVTRIGAVLRRTKLDELPQIFNIITNDMSLVGPRPCLPSQTELIRERRAHCIFTIKPGVTGLAQVNGIDMSRPALLAQCDKEYLSRRSFREDLTLLLLTAAGKGSGDRVRKNN